ncbi:cytochrome c biogenesis protein ResB [Coraliomargarita sp. SDUM461004]|uniref:Cytochrome c biogenesis protein ResB n=1 Tax=Thalassobacterium sedimentorum TaxID=3041258 RepID=A0ABU1AL00_9BACT|nr:cytochrome c biogenesis protein ResB [Coraliomargarita sp. SDUM461004]MDQ8195382.1 cytochrome c biogenesis protein ResB [Coraliomargarita sp. SDUM461004]
MKPLFKFFSSLKLTVVLLTFSMMLIFFGTLDQVQYGIWHTQKLYFESFIAVWAYPEQAPAYNQLFWLRIPMPGGYLIGGLLFINLLAAHFTRFKMTWKKSGIFLVHFGLVLLLVSELMTDLLSKESQMPVDEGGRSNYSQSHRANELVLIDRSHPDYDSVHAIPATQLKAGKEIEVPNTPLSIRVVKYYPNAEIGRANNNATAPQSPADRGAAVKMGIFVTPQPVSYADDAINTATAYVEVLSPEGSLGTWLVSNVIDERFPPQTVQAGDQSWEIALRFQRQYYPFEVELIDFSHDKYPGTEIPYNYSSEVMVHHQDSTKNQKALIYMNHPLRYEGLTFYQASFANQDRTSIFQVVRNPGWLLPYVSVLLMGLGMCVQFGMHFFKFLGKRRQV